MVKYTIAMASCKGGCSKTTSCIEIATILNQKGYSVLLIDADQQGNLSTYTDCDKTKPTLYEALHANCSVEDVIQHKEYYDVIPASESLSLADREFTGTDDIYLIADLLEYTDYDFCIIDNAPAKSCLVTMAYVACDGVICPSDVDDGSVDGVSAAIQDVYKLKNSRMHLSHADIIGILLTKYEANRNMFELTLNNLETIANNLNPKPIFMKIRKSIRISECKSLKLPLQEYEYESNPANDYRKFTDKLIRITEEIRNGR